MYILEIDPPIDKHPEDDITMMPACNVGSSACFYILKMISQPRGAIVLKKLSFLKPNLLDIQHKKSNPAKL